MPLVLDDVHTATQRGAKIQTQTLKVQKAGILTDVTESPHHGHLHHGLCETEGGLWTETGDLAWSV